MPFYLVAPRSRRTLAAYERSPRIAAVGIDSMCHRRIPEGADVKSIILEGERPFHGAPEILHHRLRQPGLRLFAPVHYPALPQWDVDLISLQPRWFTAGPQRDQFQFDYRIAAGAAGDSKALQFNLRDCREPWAGIALAVLEASHDVASALDRLRRLWARGTFPPMMRSLVLRNLIVLLMQTGDHQKARELLNLGMEAYEQYGELRYLSGLAWLIHGKYTDALHEAEKAERLAGSGDWVGSGGETGYRARWLLGVCHAFGGRQESAVNHFRDGVGQLTAFRPSVEALLDQRLPAAYVEWVSTELSQLARREPRYLAQVFEYFLLHRCFVVAERMTCTLPLSEEIRQSMRARLEAVQIPFRAETPSRRQQPGVILEAPFFQHSSFGRIGRAMAAGLATDSHLNLSLDPRGFAVTAQCEHEDGAVIAQLMLQHPPQLDLTIRLCWPPDFKRPPRGRLACIFPWEYAGLPRYWVDQMRENVDEAWVPSQFVAGVLERAGFPRDRVRVIPNGFDPLVFTPHGKVMECPDAKGFVFLFVGGAIERKGFDLLLDAYEEAFSASDEVTLIVKEFGSASFYRHNSLGGRMGKFSGPRYPRVIANGDTMDDARLASLYRRADCLVLPYRGEGFGMPLVEAMACGKPVLTTAAGPAPEFCSEDTGWLIPAERVLVPDDPPPMGEMTEPLQWFEPSFEALVQTMRYIYENHREAALRGAEAARRIHATHSWLEITPMYGEAIAGMCEHTCDAVVV